MIIHQIYPYCMASFKLPSSLSLIPSQLSKQSFLLQFWSLDLFCTLKEYPCHSDHLKAQVFVPHYFKQNSVVPTLLFLGKIQSPWLTRSFMMRPWLTFPTLSSTSLAIILLLGLLLADSPQLSSLFRIILAEENSLTQGQHSPFPNCFYPMTGPHGVIKTWSHYLNSEPPWGPPQLQSSLAFSHLTFLFWKVSLFNVFL